MIKQFDNLMQMMAAFPDEQSAIDHLTAIRWKDGAFCPHCGSVKVYHFSDQRTHKCGDCRKRFSIKVGTIFEDSKIELRKWFMAIWLLTSYKKGIASTQLAKDIGVTQKTAWFMTQRLRHAADTQSFHRPLDGEVEIDETYVGGKAANRHKGDPKNGPGTSGKTAVIGAFERGGDTIATVIARTDTETLDGFAHAVLSPSVALVSTDEHAGYRHLGRSFPHGVVRHSAGEYVNGVHHTNGIEGFWALLKRQITGTHHYLSPKHLNRYVSEMTWRFNRRGFGEGERVNALLNQVSGRLTYKELIA
ncbi:DDE transposase [Sphingopyxis lindanitolerans]|uniref:DDE transposase n=1 Tax=Sphingopyxis lindanitolerans TaxID=2054227 RepID=A0A2S8B859_9SPHN|nr:IS1595 family transposase [Sphingopyxis lindanitolerans]PQM28538.1 DDE transposase [Sphingopyxis lindanitolerans]